MAIQECFLREIWEHSVRWWHKQTIHKRFFCRIVKVFFLESFVLYGTTLNVLLSVKYLLVLACSSSNRIIEGSCVSLSGIMASIYALVCTQQFECYKYTLYIGLVYATRFESNNKTSIDKNSIHSALACT